MGSISDIEITQAWDGWFEASYGYSGLSDGENLPGAPDFVEDWFNNPTLISSRPEDATWVDSFAGTAQPAVRLTEDATISFDYTDSAENWAFVVVGRVTSTDSAVLCDSLTSQTIIGANNGQWSVTVGDTTQQGGTADTKAHLFVLNVDGGTPSATLYVDNVEIMNFAVPNPGALDDKAYLGHGVVGNDVEISAWAMCYGIINSSDDRDTLWNWYQETYPPLVFPERVGFGLEGDTNYQALILPDSPMITTGPQPPENAELQDGDLYVIPRGTDLAWKIRQGGQWRDITKKAADLLVPLGQKLIFEVPEGQVSPEFYVIDAGESNEFVIDVRNSYFRINGTLNLDGDLNSTYFRSLSNIHNFSTVSLGIEANNRIRSVGAPLDPTDAATKQYVDDQIAQALLRLDGG